MKNTIEDLTPWQQIKLRVLEPWSGFLIMLIFKGMYPTLWDNCLTDSWSPFGQNFLPFEFYTNSNFCIFLVDRKKATFVIMWLATWQCIASVLPWQPSSSCSASSCMVFEVVKIHGPEYKMASGASRSLFTLGSLWEHFSSQAENL